MHQLAEKLSALPSPSYVCDVAKLKANMAVAARVKKESGCKILLATKAFALPPVFPLMRDVLDGSTASGLYEARLGRETFGREVHVYAPAYAPGEVEALLPYADSFYFNSPDQLRLYAPLVKAAGKKVGVRINPGYSHAALGGHLYDPCAPGSRFGVPAAQLDGLPWDEIDVLHAHSLCEAMHDSSAGLMAHVAKHFGAYVRRVKTVNFGGGHFMNKPGYDVSVLSAAIAEFRAAFGVDVVLEPGAGLVVDAGYLVARVLDIHDNGGAIAILDTSASTHMPDVLEVPYTPQILGAATGDDYPHRYILGGKTCMTGDVIGTYTFPQPLKVGDSLVFTDMMQYSFVKNNTFNGTPLPALALLHEDGRTEVLREFGYADFLHRLGG